MNNESVSLSLSCTTKIFRNDRFYKIYTERIVNEIWNLPIPPNFDKKQTFSLYTVSYIIHRHILEEAVSFTPTADKILPPFMKISCDVIFMYETNYA